MSIQLNDSLEAFVQAITEAVIHLPDLGQADREKLAKVHDDVIHALYREDIDY